MEDKGFLKDIITSKYEFWRSLNKHSEFRWWIDVRIISKRGKLGGWFNESMSRKVGISNKITYGVTFR